MNYYVGNIVASPTLEHHGVLGQKWGVRNGPPYPLDASDHSSSEKKAGWKKSLANDGELTEKRKTMRAAKKAYNKAYSKLDNNAILAYSPIKSHREKYNRLADDFDDKQRKYFDAKADYKNGKKRAKELLKEHGQKSIRQLEHEKRITSLQEQLGITDEQAEDIKKWAKVAGISLATAAGVAAAGYYIAHRPQNIRGYNIDPNFKSKVIPLGEKLFYNSTNDDYIGKIATQTGYGTVSAGNLLNAIKNRPSYKQVDFDALVQHVRKDVMTWGSFRRLSCWSGSQAYFFTGMTGTDYVSKSFNNLVDFNDFGKLYKTAPEIFTVTGQRAKNFVGKFGRLGIREISQLEKHNGELRAGSRITAKALSKSIFQNISSKNNLAVDGKTTIGFINAAYHSETCTHQWNFELIQNAAKGTRDLVMADGYVGRRYVVGTMRANGTIKYAENGISKLARELHHYNADSIRFYAPSLDSLNLDMLSNVILGKP